jgi:hypothetical protein
MLVLAMVVAGGVFAQAGGSGKMAVSLDLAPLLTGFVASNSDEDMGTEIGIFALSPDFEMVVAPHYTIGAGMDLYFGKVEDTSITYFGLNAQGRWYALSTGLDKFFIEAGIGFNLVGIEDMDDPEFFGLTFGLKSGWKQFIKGGFFVEPSLGYVIAKSSGTGIPTPLGWEIGLSIGVGF